MKKARLAQMRGLTLDESITRATEDAAAGDLTKHPRPVRRCYCSDKPPTHSESRRGRERGRIEACVQASRFAFATSPLKSALRMRLVSGTEHKVQHSSAAHQKEGPDRAWKTRTGDEQAAFPCRRSDVLAMREKS
jgi:hypothetical protein